MPISAAQAIKLVQCELPKQPPLQSAMPVPPLQPTRLVPTTAARNEMHSHLVSKCSVPFLGSNHAAAVLTSSQPAFLLIFFGKAKKDALVALRAL